MYDSLLIDQSLGLNRRRDDEKDVKTEVTSICLLCITDNLNVKIFITDQ